MPAVLTALIAVVAEHRRCGELDDGVDRERIWLATAGPASRIRSNRPS
jgi:hypothetical protein